MSKRYFISYLLIFILGSCIAKPSNGYVLLNSGEKINVYISDGGVTDNSETFSGLQWEIKYIDSLDKTRYLDLAIVKELHFSIDTEMYRMVCFKNDFKIAKSHSSYTHSYVMLYLVIEDELSLYSFFDSPVGRKTEYHGNVKTDYDFPIGMGERKVHILKLKGKEPIKINNFKFKKPILEYLRSCNEVSKKIENDTYGRRDILLIVDEYNELCK